MCWQRLLWTLPCRQDVDQPSCRPGLLTHQLRYLNFALLLIHHLVVLSAGKNQPNPPVRPVFKTASLHHYVTLGPPQNSKRLQEDCLNVPNIFEIRPVHPFTPEKWNPTLQCVDIPPPGVSRVPFHILFSPGGLGEELIFNQLPGREIGEQRNTPVYMLLVINQLQTDIWQHSLLI